MLYFWKIKCRKFKETQVVAVKDIQHNNIFCFNIYYKITENIVHHDDESELKKIIKI